MRKQVRTFEEHIVCDVCGRTMLKGERTEAYLTPSRDRRLVCQLCAPRAQQEGWIRESANPSTPARPPRPQEGGRRFRRARKAAVSLGRSMANGDVEAAEPLTDGGTTRARKARFRRDPRHVRAVPTNAQLKLERAIELFNESEHPRTVAGIGRALGSPHVSASTSASSAAEVVLTVAWDISWYQFVVDLSETHHPVRMEARGEELGQLDEEKRDWNATTLDDGTITLGTSEAGEEADTSDGMQPEEVL